MRWCVLCSRVYTLELSSSVRHSLYLALCDAGLLTLGFLSIFFRASQNNLISVNVALAVSSFASLLLALIASASQGLYNGRSSHQMTKYNYDLFHFIEMWNLMPRKEPYDMNKWSFCVEASSALPVSPQLQKLRWKIIVSKKSFAKTRKIERDITTDLVQEDPWKEEIWNLFNYTLWRISDEVCELTIHVILMRVLVIACMHKKSKKLLTLIHLLMWYLSIHMRPQHSKNWFKNWKYYSSENNYSPII